ncbi:MAG: YfbM family protein [Pseudomonadota bacterium]
MGMVLELRRCASAELARIEAASEEEVYETAFPGDLVEALYESGHWIDLDKLWHAIHFLLCGVVFTDVLPEGFIFGGTEVSEDQGYGPIRILRPDDVVGIADFLTSLEPEMLIQRFDPKTMTKQDIYPGVWKTGDAMEDADVKDELGKTYETLRHFVLNARNSAEGIVLSLS